MELKQIEYFLQLAKMQHMSRTAEFLNISQPTLSKSLNALERDLGVSLFDRVGNRLQLNDSGKQFYSKAQQAMHTLGNAVISAKQASFEVSGEVSIVCIAFAPILVPCICAYMELNPKVNVRLLHFNHLLNSSGEVDYDFILTASRYAPDLGEGDRLWVTQPLFAEDAYFIISPRHPLFGRLPENDADFDLAQFSEASFITMRQDACYTDFSGDLCQNAGFVLKSYFQSDDFLVKMMVIREGKAVGFLPRSGLELARSICPNLRAVHCPLPGGDRTVQLMRKKKSLLSETALDFWDFVLDHFNLPPDGED